MRAQNQIRVRRYRCLFLSRNLRQLLARIGLRLLVFHQLRFQAAELFSLLRSFQLQTIATTKPRSRKRTYAFAFRSMRTLRFLLIARAGRLARIDGHQVLRLTRTRQPKRSTTEWLMLLARELFSDQG